MCRAKAALSSGCKSRHSSPSGQPARFGNRTAMSAMAESLEAGRVDTPVALKENG